MEINSKIFEYIGKLYIESQLKIEHLNEEVRKISLDKENLIKLIEAAGLNEPRG